MFVTKKLTKEKIERRRTERKSLKRKNQNPEATHYIRVEQNPYKKELYFKKLFRKRRYYLKKLFFTVAANLGFVEEQQKRKPTKTCEKH